MDDRNYIIGIPSSINEYELSFENKQDAEHIVISKSFEPKIKHTKLVDKICGFIMGFIACGVVVILGVIIHIIM